MHLNSDENFMHRAIDLAYMGLGKVSPNPMVGCVIVHNDKIIGEGWHMEFGGPHAEVKAIQSVREPDLLSECTVYINLEPCSFHGKTPPCTDLLINSNVRKVVLGIQDPNPRVSGNGIKILREHGIEVVENILPNESNDLNRRFLVNQEQKRPYVLLKWAQTADKYIAMSDLKPRWISSMESRKLVHKWRSEEDSVLIGMTTAEKDNPHLTVRDWIGRNPVRIVLDPESKLNSDLHVLDQKAPTLIYNLRKNSEVPNLTYIKIDNNVEFIQGLLSDMLTRGIGSVIVEGGAETLNSFIKFGLWDEARVFTSGSKFGAGISAPTIELPVFAARKVGDDLLEIYRNKQK